MGLLNRNKVGSSLPALGVDIGSGIVKVVQARRDTTRLDLTGAASFSVEAGAVEAGIVLDPRRYGKRLADCLASQKIGASAAMIAIPSGLAVLRWLQLPALDGKDLREAARFKVKRHLPFPVESAYIEATPPEILNDGSSGQSLVIAVPRAVIDSRAEALEYAGQTPVGAELEAQAILRVVERRLSERGAIWRDASLTIIDVGANNTHMYVVQNQRLQFIRGVKFGTMRVAEAVSRELNVGLPEAEILMSQPDTELWPEGVLKIRLGEVFHFVYVSSELDKLNREFLRLLRYFRSLHPERSYAGILDHVVVCGGLASMTGFAEYLEGVLELRVERARPFAGMVAKLDRASFESSANRQEAYTVAVGLALSVFQGTNLNTGVTSARREFSWTRAA